MSKTHACQHNDKPWLDLVFEGFPRSLKALANAMRNGAEKYAPHDWKYVDDWRLIYRRKIYRHLLEWAEGAERDQESGQSPMDHLIADCLIYRERELLECDERLGEYKWVRTSDGEWIYEMPSGVDWQEVEIVHDTEGEQKSRAADCSVEARVNNATDFACIDAAARAWIEAGGDADGVTRSWHHIRDRVGELE